ncbi:toxin-antitoxin system HicB family antitoxin [Lacisediminihabitans changchengi]|uniref:Toxin-antitoxin system HicB family antitoxin n=1 Tax=Lacisediminihabitans changchengi TaxID=2787634 RepID=A0A934W2E2_9MICO|nr:toxin-antitoxin system HicB family antitoxin [Lacisediminihabitans changchengi]MBK4347054.1 toxin-antitoxin system HicB family antitoxin [Lacisediminihabitans changchengi]MBK4347823.1 toxin-antitoxin system HicB family antitoxin [Lacisediminihabitans changchengi]
MNLLPYIERLHEQLLVAADAGGDDARALAERMTAPLESAARLMLLDALSGAAAEITVELAPGSVDVRLRGVDPEFVVSTPTAPEPSALQPSALQSPTGAVIDTVGSVEVEEGSTSRTTLRLPDHLKSRAEAAAAREGLSVNTWLVRAVSAALDGPDRRPSRPAAGEQNFTGWTRS